jgi:hypothetical protein
MANQNKLSFLQKISGFELPDFSSASWKSNKQGLLVSKIDQQLFYPENQLILVYPKSKLIKDQNYPGKIIGKYRVTNNNEIEINNYRINIHNIRTIKVKSIILRHHISNGWNFCCIYKGVIGDKSNSDLNFTIDQDSLTQTNRTEYGKNEHSDSISFWLNKHFTVAKNQDNNANSLNYFLALFIISCIPVFGFIMLIRWTNDNGDNTRKNLSKASLILIAAFVLIGVILNVVIFSLL